MSLFNIEEKIEQYLNKNIENIAKVVAKHLSITIEVEEDILSFSTKIGNITVSESQVDIGKILKQKGE